MKKISILFFCLIMSVIANASQLFLLETGSPHLIKSAFGPENITIHYFTDKFTIASTDSDLPEGSIILDRDAWNDPGKHYFILRYTPTLKEPYMNAVRSKVDILYEAEDFCIVRVESHNVPGLFPAIHGGMIRITSRPVQFEARPINYQPGSLSPRDFIADLIAQVDMDTLEAFVQHLQDFGTRNAYKAGSVEAQNWILSKFQSYGLSAELHDFYMPGGQASDNVIATITGTLYPDEYVIIGAHYDSRSNSGNNEPGADDNATGTAGVLEAARILSHYQFDRSIILATWSGEEYGLYGSDAWASEAADEDMNILGYFNIDMAGYLAPGEVIHTDIIAPSSANELRQFYKDVCAIYLPDFLTFNGALSGGDSDHTSFNNNGFQGIFPFEDSQNYSPYIHTANDLIGPSVNNFEQHKIFVQAALASLVSLADQLARPEELVAIAGDMQVDLQWNGVDSASYYNIYRNMDEEVYATSSELNYTDNNVENFTSYSYYVTAVYEGTGEESGASNITTVIPMPPISLPFYDDFETGAPYWDMDGSWGLQAGTYHSSSYALTESPSGDYDANLDIVNTLRALDFSAATSAQMSFWTRYNIETDYDYMYLEISENGTEWEQLDEFTGIQNNWVEKSYSLDNYTGKPVVIIRFRFTSDVYIEEDGMYIDDLQVMINGVSIAENSGGDHPFLYPNPASDHVLVTANLTEKGEFRVALTDITGKMVSSTSVITEGKQQHKLDVSGLPEGCYFIIVTANDVTTSHKLIITR